MFRRREKWKQTLTDETKQAEKLDKSLRRAYDVFTFWKRTIFVFAVRVFWVVREVIPDIQIDC